MQIFLGKGVKPHLEDNHSWVKKPTETWRECIPKLSEIKGQENLAKRLRDSIDALQDANPYTNFEKEDLFISLTSAEKDVLDQLP